MGNRRLSLDWLVDLLGRWVRGQKKTYRMSYRNEYVLFPAICGDDLSDPGKDCIVCRKCL